MNGIGHREPFDEKQLVDGHTGKATSEEQGDIFSLQWFSVFIELQYQPEKRGGDQHPDDVQAERLDQSGCNVFDHTEIDTEDQIG